MTEAPAQVDGFELAASILEAPADDDQGDEKADETTAEILDLSETTQLALVAALSERAQTLIKSIAEGDKEASAEAAVILRGLASHSSAELLRALTDAPELADLIGGAHADETMPPEWDDEGAGDGG